MRSPIFLTLTLGVTLLSFACGGASSSSSTQPATTPGRAALSIRVEPNPIVARQVRGETYEFPFTVSIRESNGVAVNIDRVSVNVRALGTITVYEEAYGATDIARLGYPTALAGGAELRYAFKPQKEVPDDRLFGGVTADLRVEGTDANGNRVTANTDVTVSR